VSKFSSIVRWPKQRRPSITWMQPRRTSSLGERCCTSAPSNEMVPLVTSPRRLVASLGALRPAGILLDIVGRSLLQQRLHLVVHRLDPVGDLRPLRTIPLLHVSGAMAVMVGASGLHDCSEVRKAELLPASLGWQSGLRPPQCGCQDAGVVAAVRGGSAIIS